MKNATSPTSTRISLILRVADERDVQAWQEFTEIYQPLVYRLARHQGLQEADAQDLVQEVMTRVARSVSGWDPDTSRGSFRAWISRIARNLIIDFLRRQSRLPQTGDRSGIRQLLEQIPGDASESDYVDLEVEKQIFAWAARQVRDQFSAKTWQAFWQTAVQQRPVQQLAAELEMTPGAIYIARSRVMSRLKEVVQTQQQSFNE